MVHAWADMLYNICTYNVFRGDLPIVNIRFYIDLMCMAPQGIPEAQAPASNGLWEIRGLEII